MLFVQRLRTAQWEARKTGRSISYFLLSGTDEILLLDELKPTFPTDVAHKVAHGFDGECLGVPFRRTVGDLSRLITSDGMELPI